MRTTLPLLLMALAAIALAIPAAAQATTTPDPGTCAQESAHVFACNVQLHEIGPNGPFHELPERIGVVNGVQIQVGDTLKLHVVNTGNNTHNLMVCGDGNTPADNCNDIWAFTQNMAPHSEKDITVESLPKAGTFYYYCSLPGHAQIGMSGDLTVASNGAKKSGSEAALGAILSLAALALLLRRR